MLFAPRGSDPNLFRLAAAQGTPLRSLNQSVGLMTSGAHRKSLVRETKGWHLVDFAANGFRPGGTMSGSRVEPVVSIYVVSRKRRPSDE